MPLFYEYILVIVMWPASVVRITCSGFFAPLMEKSLRRRISVGALWREGLRWFLSFYALTLQCCIELHASLGRVPQSKTNSGVPVNVNPIYLVCIKVMNWWNAGEAEAEH